MSNTNASAHPPTVCQICGKVCRKTELLPTSHLYSLLLEHIHAHYPTFSADGFICRPDLNRIRHEIVEQGMIQENGELNALQQEVLRSMKENELLAKNVNAEFESHLSFGDRLADKVAEFGGSWRFIILFLSIMAIWIGINTVALFTKPFDPYPYILLNLVLSCMASIQAPVIMMSQNRQEERDRLRSEEDFRTNLKAELEVRHLNAKIDELLTHQWQRLLEIQQIQLDMMTEMTTHHQWEKTIQSTADPIPVAEVKTETM